MMTSGKIGYEVGANIDATGFGGIGAVHRLAVRLGLVDEINDGLGLLKVHLPYHESDHVLNLAYNVLCGGTRLRDLERLRHDTAYMNALGADLIPDPTTAGDFCRRFTTDDVVALMEAINRVRPKLWTGRGRELPGPIAYIDVDGTLAPTTGAHKAGMDISYKGIWGYAPLIVSLANTKEVLYLVNRPGNAPSQQGAAEWIDRAIALAPACRAGVSAWRHRLLADRQLRPLGRAGRLCLRDGQQRRVAFPRRSARRDGLEPSAAARGLRHADRQDPPPRTRPQAPYRHRTRLRQPRAQP
jgi:hypothetical protein